MTDKAISRLAPQQRKPTPMGAMSGKLLRLGDSWRVLMHWEMFLPKLERSVPAPRKPRPPARETLTARWGPAMTRKGAETMSGEEVHG